MFLAPCSHEVHGTQSEIHSTTRTIARNMLGPLVKNGSGEFYSNNF